MSAAAGQSALPLEGSLEDPATLPRLLAGLGRGQWTGAVAVSADDVERWLYLAEGRLQTVESTDPAEDPVTLLIGKGQVTEADVRGASAHVGREPQGLPFARKLVELGLVEAQALASVERDRVVAAAQVALSRRHGQYRCEPGATPADSIAQLLEIPQLVAMTVLSGWDETWAMNVLGGMGSRFRLVFDLLPEYEATGADEAYDLTLVRVDGKRTVEELLELSPLPETAAVKFLAACRLIGSIEPSVEPVIGQAPAARPVSSVPDVAVPEPAARPPETTPEAPQAVPSAAPESAAQYHRPTEPAAPRGPGARPAAAERPPETEQAETGRSFLLLLLLLVLLSVVMFYGLRGWKSFTGSAPPPPPNGTAGAPGRGP